MSLTSWALFALFVAYGVYFWVMAAGVWYYREHTAKLGIADRLWLLAAFAFVHGFSDLIDVVLRVPHIYFDPHGVLPQARLTLLVLSFITLFQFGIALLVENRRTYQRFLAASVLVSLVVLVGPVYPHLTDRFDLETFSLTERLARLVFGLPAALAASWGFYRIGRRCGVLGLSGCATDSRVAAAALVLYGIVAGAVATGYPSALRLWGVPIQAYRMLAAVTLTLASVRLLRRFGTSPASPADTALGDTSTN